MSWAEKQRGELKIPNGRWDRLVRHDENNLHTTTGHQVVPLMGKEPGVHRSSRLPGGTE